MCKWIHTYSTLSLFSCSYSFTLPPIRSPISRGTHFPSYSFAFFSTLLYSFYLLLFLGNFTHFLHLWHYLPYYMSFFCMYVCSSLNFCGAYHFYEVYIYLKKKKYCACIMNTCKVYILEFCMFLLRSILSSFFFS